MRTSSCRDEVGDLKARVPLANLSTLSTSGVDLNVSYGVPLPCAGGVFGHALDVSLLVTWLESWELDEVEYVRTIGGFNYAGAFPDYKASLRLGYTVGPVDLSYGLQFLDAMDNQGNIEDFGQRRRFKGVGSTLYHELSALWRMRTTVEVSVGVRNLTDVEPKPFDVPIDQDTDPSSYDMLGRFFFGSLRAKF